MKQLLIGIRTMARLTSRKTLSDIQMRFTIPVQQIFASGKVVPSSTCVQRLIMVNVGGQSRVAVRRCDGPRRSFCFRNNKPASNPSFLLSCEKGAIPLLVKSQSRVDGATKPLTSSHHVHAKVC